MLGPTQMNRLGNDGTASPKKALASSSPQTSSSVTPPRPVTSRVDKKRTTRYPVATTTASSSYFRPLTTSTLPSNALSGDVSRETLSRKSALNHPLSFSSRFPKGG